MKENSRKAKYAVTNKTDAEKAALEATNDDKWGPANTQMQEICRMCNNYKDCEDIKRIIWERLGDIENVRHVQKSLFLLEYLISNDPESFRSDTRAMSGQLQSLTNLRNNDVGEKAALETVIRKKSEDILNLVNDNNLYRMRREKAQKLKSFMQECTNDRFESMYSTSVYNQNYDYSQQQQQIQQRQIYQSPFMQPQQRQSLQQQQQSLFVDDLLDLNSIPVKPIHSIVPNEKESKIHISADSYNELMKENERLRAELDIKIKEINKLQKQSNA